nr:TPA_asm: m44.8 sORF 2 [Murid betaherpesvirus 1]DBA07782.1 TPA_asm: m44.8 sORF 2 [Murid betaherpesvirus 1]
MRSLAGSEHFSLTRAQNRLLPRMPWQ